MQRIAFSVSAALLAFNAAIAPAQTTDDLFNDRILQEIRLDVRASDWASLKLHFLDNTYYPSDFHWKLNGRDVLVRDIGIRSRGHGSRSPDKPNLRVDFNRYEPGQQFLGLSSLVLKANNQDGSMLREQTWMKLWGRTGMPAPREAFCRLYVNNQYYGVYLLTEEIRDSFTERYLGEKGGDLYKFDPIGDGYRFEWNPTCTAKITIACSTDPAKWAEAPFNPEENKSDYDITPTINFIRMTNQVSDADFERTISAFVDFRYMASYIAMENFTTDVDSFLGDVYGMNNFFIYRYNKTNLHQLLPWDKDLSYDWSARPVFWNSDKNILMRRILGIPAYRTQFLASSYLVARLAGGAGGWLEWEHEREYQQARDSVYEDPFKQYSVSGLLYPNTNEIFEAEVGKNRSFLGERAAFVLRDVGAAGWQPSSAVSVSEGGVLNAATNAPGPAAPGSYISIYGSGFANSTVVAPSTPFPTSLAGVTVIINGFLAPIYFVSPGQINVLVPWELGMGNGTAPVSVIVNGTTLKGTRAGSPVNGSISNAVLAAVAPYAPGVFAVTQGDGSLLTTKAAGAGDTLTIYANGLGPLSEAIASGAAAPTDRLVYTTGTPSVTIGGTGAPVVFSGMAPGFVGAYQVNVTVPPGVRAGSASLIIAIGGQTSSGFTIPTR
jgi:uncharacterized protein (TIGR03437 family)